MSAAANALKIKRKDLKLLVIGNSGVGKTSLVQRWIGKDFKEDTTATTVSEVAANKLYKLGETLFKVQLWDIGGQDKTPAVTKIFTKDSHGCIIVSDITDKSTLDDTLDWKKAVEEEIRFTDGGNIPFLLIQNKMDLIEDPLEKDNLETETKGFSRSYGFVNYFMTSAKTKGNTEDAIQFFMEHVSRRLMNYLEAGNEDVNTMEHRRTVAISKGGSVPEKEQKEKKKNCCK